MSTDKDYFRGMLLVLLRDLDSYTPKELSRILTSVALKADAETALITAQLHQLESHKN